MSISWLGGVVLNYWVAKIVIFSETAIPSTKFFTYFRPKFLKAKMRNFMKLRKVFVNLSAHFRPMAKSRKSTLARRGSDWRQRRYTDWQFYAPTLPRTSSTAPKTAASVHGNGNSCTDATKQHNFQELSEVKCLICLIFTGTSCISGEMRDRTEGQTM